MNNRFDKALKLSVACSAVDHPVLEPGKLGTGLPECEPTLDYEGCDEFPELGNKEITDPAPLTYSADVIFCKE